MKQRKAIDKQTGEARYLLRRLEPEGKLIIEEGDIGNEAYIIESGRVRVFRRSDSGEVELAVLGPGSLFGEMALIDDSPRMANVRALEPTVLVEINKHTLAEELNKSPKFVRAIVRMLLTAVRQHSDMMVNMLANDGKRSDNRGGKG